MKILLTGGAGYVGSHAAKALSQAGHEVVVVDNLSRGHRWAVRGAPLEVADLTDEPALRRIFRAHQPEAVMHFAAFAYVGESMAEPGRYFRNNVEGSFTLLRVMLEHDVKDIVFSSTCATYGTPGTLPIREDAPQNPVNPYGESKKMVESALRWYADCHGLRYAALRYFNAAGDDPDGEIGECHRPETHLIPSIIETALGQRAALRIFGDDFPTPDGTCQRDYVHVCDLATAHLLALQRLRARGGTLQVNLGTGQAISVHQMVRMVEQVSGRRIPVHIAARRDGDPAALVADPSRAAEQLGWQPRHSSLEEIVGTAWAWHSKHLGKRLEQSEWPVGVPMSGQSYQRSAIGCQP
ncbi:UDP-glucose 4-epimerase GalE [uncultured Paludibaculum sp.]|uniref:UDP-glucose 4-epimerase GalE n=1 Tax=uncultured Paludibaculum sp. TaxID=1765020 RepID=UPI002AAB0553|nr:UDP-glucose 4-epimerase GalE [uncultured Paludibaculum sp.]